MKSGVSLFTGGGLCDTGLSSLVSWVAGVEFDPAIAAHATLALGHPVHCADVREVDYRQWRGVDYLHMSPPCTNASVANANAGETEVDLSLGAACIRAIEEINPGYVTLENVWQYRNFESFRGILNHLSGQGYRVHFASYDAADFGVPQHRNRLMLRAWKEDSPLPEVLPTHGSPREVTRSRAQGSLFGEAIIPWNGWFEAVADLLPSCPDTALAPWQVKRLTAEYGEEWLESILVRTNGEAGELGVGKGKCCPSLTADSCGKTRAVIAESLLVNGVPSNHAGEIDAREEERPSPPLTASIEKHPMRAVLVEGQSKGKRAPSLTEQGSPSPAQAGTGGGNLNRAILTAPYRVVALTPRCLARFQSLPDSYPLPSKKSLATKIIGNGVACKAAEAIFGSILRSPPPRTKKGQEITPAPSALSAPRYSL